LRRAVAVGNALQDQRRARRRRIDRFSPAHAVPAALRLLRTKAA
jgi:hypothetical protein